jgi:hypothetical protein
MNYKIGIVVAAFFLMIPFPVEATYQQPKHYNIIMARTDGSAVCREMDYILTLPENKNYLDADGTANGTDRFEMFKIPKRFKDFTLPKWQPVSDAEFKAVAPDLYREQVKFLGSLTLTAQKAQIDVGNDGDTGTAYLINNGIRIVFVGPNLTSKQKNFNQYVSNGMWDQGFFFRDRFYLLHLSTRILYIVAENDESPNASINQPPSGGIETPCDWEPDYFFHRRR